MPQKIIPKTSENNYISGWEALNIPNEKGDVADWTLEHIFSQIILQRK